jgi:flagellar biosynthesis protein FliR
MFLEPDQAGWLLAHGAVWALVLARVAGMAAIAPAWGAPELGWRLRLGLCVLLAFVIVPAVGPGLKPPVGMVALGGACLAEGLLGAALGWAAALVIAGARQGGELVAAQAGLSPASLLDLGSTDGVTPLGHLYGLVALAVFVAIDGPLALVRALLESYRVVPVGNLAVVPQTAEWVFGLVGQGLVVALQVAAPVALALVLAGVALGLLGRAAPSLHALALALPVRSAVGLVLLVIGLATLVATLTACWAGLGGAFLSDVTLLQ